MKIPEDQTCYGMGIMARVLLLLRLHISLLRLKGEYFSAVLSGVLACTEMPYSCP